MENQFQQPYYQQPVVARKNIVTCIILSLITCGIYSIYWFCTLTDDTKRLTNDVAAPSGGMAFLLTLITCGIYGFYWCYKQGERIDNAKIARGIPSSNSGIIYLVLQFIGLGIVSYALMQDQINKMA